MLIQAIKTPVFKPKDNLFQFIKNNVPNLKEESVLIVTSKIVSYAENRFVPKTDYDDKTEKHELAKKEADIYLDPNGSKYNLMLTVKNGILAVNAGLDESNSINGNYILWPKNPQQSANQIWKFLRKDYKLKKIGVIITDSKTMPLKWGVTGTCIAHCGFKALHDYRGTPDIFGRLLKMEQTNVAESIAIAAVLETGESDQQMPLAIASNIKLIEFVNHPLTPQELKDLTIEFEEDVYYPVLKNANWHQGRSGK